MLLIVTTFFVACNCWGLSSYQNSPIFDDFCLRINL